MDVMRFGLDELGATEIQATDGGAIILAAALVAGVAVGMVAGALVVHMVYDIVTR